MKEDYHRSTQKHCRTMEDDRQIRTAAENLLSGSINSQRSSYMQQSLTRTSDVILSEDLIAGARHGGKISNVRRFFCLFVAFDLLLTVLMWLICTMIAGESLEAAFMSQVVHYHIKTSLFDIVMAAICRFTVLLLFYALLHLNHWIFVAMSTAITCAFLITKVFLFDWTAYSQPVFQVLLIIASFVLAWVEAWFFDFRVIPQETYASNWTQNMSDAERAPLIRAVNTDSRQYSSTEPPRTFYTPVDSPDHSDTENEIVRKQDVSRRMSKTSDVFIAKPLPIPPPDKIIEYRKIVNTLVKNCHHLLTTQDWKTEYTTSHGDVACSKYVSELKMTVSKITGTMDISAHTLIDWLFDEVESSPSWNKLITDSMRIQQVDENTDITYQTTSPQGGGLIGSRDFVVLRHRIKYGNFYIITSTSVSLPTFPNRKHVIRGENAVSCFAAEELAGEKNKCRFTWILNTDLKGWIPQKVVDKSVTQILGQFMTCLRNHLNEIPKLSSV